LKGLVCQGNIEFQITGKGATKKTPIPSAPIEGILGMMFGFPVVTQIS